MRTVSVAIAALLLLMSGVAPAAAQTPKTEVMVVGVAHLVARNDVHNSVYQDDPLSPKRQRQIDDIIVHLAQFHPTKVLIEADFGETEYADNYRSYLAGHYALGAEETYQFGFKLAARAGNTTVYPIDTDGPQIIDDSSPTATQIEKYLSTNMKNVKDPELDAFIKKDHDLQLGSTYLDELRYLNSEAAIHASASAYSVLDGMGREASQAGSAYVAQWYTRNCYIFSNILSVIRPGDRVVVLMGQGHKYLLREFTRLNPNLTYVDPLPYLK